MRLLSRLRRIFQRPSASSSEPVLPTYEHAVAPPDLFIKRPTELVDQFSYVLSYGPNDYPGEDGGTNATNFAEMFKALDFFREHTRSTEGREAIDQVIRNLHVAYEKYEADNELEASTLLQETEKLFQRARRYIAISDE